MNTKKQKFLDRNNLFSASVILHRTQSVHNSVKKQVSDWIFDFSRYELYILIKIR